MVPLMLRNVSEFTTRMVAVVEGKDQGGDYLSYWAAGKLADGRAYEVEAMLQMEQSLHGPLADGPQVLRQPPVVLPAMRFLADRHPAVGFALCTLVEAFLLGVLIGVTTRWVAVTPLAGAAWVSLCLGWAPLWEALHGARWSAVVAAVAFMAALACLRSGDRREGGLCLTGMLLHQPFYFLPLALFLGLTRRFRALAGLTVGAAMLSLFSVLAGGAEGYLHSFLDVSRLFRTDLLLLVPALAVAGPWSQPALPLALGLFVWLSSFPGLPQGVVFLLAAGLVFLVKRR